MNVIIMPCVNNLAMTQRCLQSCLDQDIPVTVLVIDNASIDGTNPWLRSLIHSGYKNIILFTHLRPRSLNRVWNESLTFAFDKLKCEHALVINNDIIMRPDMYRSLLADGGQFVTGVSVSEESGIKTSNPRSASPHPSFSCFLIRKEVWDRVGKFDEEYWAWASDGDYHLRMDRMGIDAYALAIPFYHEVSGTLKHSDHSMRDALQRRSDADRATFLRKWGFAIGSPEYYQTFQKERENRYASTGRLD